MKKILSLAVCTALVANIVPLHIKANESGGDVQVSENGNRITIGNGYIKRVFENNNGKWKTVRPDPVARLSIKINTFFDARVALASPIQFNASRNFLKLKFPQ